MDEFEFVFTDFSTLGVDNLAKGGKTGFVFSLRPASPARHEIQCHAQSVQLFF